MEESIKNDERMSKCPRYDYCDSPKCPLDELISIRVRLKEDEKCKLCKRIRLRLGKDMKTRGLTTREIQGYKAVYGSLDNALRTILK